ncbi:MAG TPA: sn-glycerol-3-phosphate ABC transporter ATP-binding protein UgpC [Baekduia sp.]|uniref:ABC transporter ATP-binding protein n=1 Tax=Baekduia sp. TaxID=2600305 RepID=UPI002D7998F7|nr:sn-glycerol-3-phosphate ABC transporter ATP-binding protein UgpC [Baekduia sp.]HET6507095.1 sn-glycerol-3-phosphate ABC transporter ATP-binding protein UgpC [Baekduia sp.]
MAGIVFDDVTKRYPDGTQAVSGLDLEVADGELLILVGPSGCGKSTALRMVAGLEEVSDGALRIDGRVVNDLAPKDRDVAMVFQNYALYPQMTVRQNMGFALKLAKVSKAEVDAKVREAAEVLDLTEHLDRRPGALSGGQRQRVAMGRAIVRAPKAFLMDEPLSNLDAKLRVQMRASIAHLQDRLGSTMLYVTHDQVEAMTLGDRVAVMRGGVLQQVGPPKVLYQRPANVFVAGFIGSPPMNFLPGELADDGLATPLGFTPLPDDLRQAVAASTLAGRAVVAGIRPEHLTRQRPDTALPALRFAATVDLAEELGAEVLAHFSAPPAPADLPDRALVARLTGATGELARGTRLDLWLDPHGLELFDPETGYSLRTAAPA